MHFPVKDGGATLRAAIAHAYVYGAADAAESARTVRCRRTKGPVYQRCAFAISSSFLPARYRCKGTFASLLSCCRPSEELFSELRNVKRRSQAHHQRPLSPCSSLKSFMPDIPTYT